jgi:hypothetical protein
MNVEDVEALWVKYEQLLQQFSGENNENITKMCEELGDRIIAAPASRLKDEYHATLGGLVAHSLEVAQWVLKLAEPYGLEAKRETVFAALLHDLGKIGDLDHDYLIDQDSDWHRDKLGAFYKWNPDCPKMSVTHRTLFLLQHYNIRLTREQWVAIQLAGGSHFEENRFYVGSEPLMAVVLQHAKQMAIRGHKA